MTGMLIGYARVSTAHQDVAAQCAALQALGVAPKRVYVDQGLSGATRERPGLTTGLAACRPGDTLVVTELDRLARSLPDARDISAESVARDKGWLNGRPPKLTPAQERHLVDVHAAGTHTVAELAGLFGVGRATVYRAVDRARARL